MFDQSELAHAVETQQRSYRLLLWVGGALQRGFIRVADAHEYSGERAAAEAWLSRQFLNLPPDCRPLERTGPELRQYANFFSSYLLTSFELQRDPGRRLVSGCGCYCPFCSHLVAAPYLKPKKLNSRDKQRAQMLKRGFIEALARQNVPSIDQTKLDRLLSDVTVSRTAALATYGKELLLRCQGQGLSSPASLALWREFAWKPTGSPDPRFKLRAKDILEAERRLVAAIAA